MAFTDFFSLLSILPAFDLDSQALETAYFKAQRSFHPDRFVGKSANEREAAIQQSANINQAYDTLKDPLKRARYLLLLQGIFVGSEKDNVKPSGDLLAEVMEWREAVAEAENRSELYAQLDILQALHKKTMAAISAAYTKGRWDDMAQLTLKLGYIEKTLEDIKIQSSRYQ